MKNADTVFAKSKYLAISELGSRYGLSFSSHLILGNRIIALDGVKKLLLVVETDKDASSFIIDLNKVAAVTVRKSYGSINQGELKSKEIEAFLKRIDLHFHLTDNTETIVLPFYNSETDDKKDRPKLAKNAKNWQMILSKIAGLKIYKPGEERNGLPMMQLPLANRTYV